MSHDQTLDIFADLEQSLIRAVSESQSKANREALKLQVKAARARIAQPSCEKDERAELVTLIESWEQANIWATAGIAAMVKRSSCSCCGSLSHSPDGYYKHQVGRKDPTLQRWVKLVQFNPVEFDSIPKEVIFRDEVSDFCMTCLDTSQFDLTKGMVKCLTPALVEKLHEQV